MWNPDIYRDADYGLEDDESFEPSDDIEEEFRPADGEPFVQTVLGPIRPEEAGVALIHEHLQWRPLTADHDPDNRLDDVQAALLDLEAFFSASGRTLVSATPASCGRNATQLIWLAQHAPVHLVAVTGFGTHPYLERYYRENVHDRMVESLQRDLSEGMDGTGAKPGMLTVGTGEGGTTALERHAVALVGEAHRRHHLPVQACAKTATDALEQVTLLERSGVAPSRVVAGPIDGAADDDIRAVAETGAFVSIVLSGDGSTGDDQKVAKQIAWLIRDGYRDQILVSHGFSRQSLLTGYSGRPGLSYIVEQFAVMLMEEDIGALDVRNILAENAARAMSIVEPGDAG